MIPKVTDYLSPMTINLLVSMGAGALLGWLLKGKWNRQLSLRENSPDNAISVPTKKFIPGESGEYKMVLVIRMDLKMGKGKVAAQCSHAAVGCYRQASTSHPQDLERWEQSGQPKITLKAPDEETLLTLTGQARSLGLVTSLIQDAGRTQIAPGSKTVLGIGPGPGSLIDQVTGDLKLY